MHYTPITSFRRPLDAGQIAHLKAAARPAPTQSVDKWTICNELAVARTSFDLSDRAMSVLQALLSFHPARELSGAQIVVFPSNAAICERLSGMACSTMRRHLAALIEAGFLLRRDSPNGKRYVKRYRDDARAFGFDLSPLLARWPEIQSAADTCRATKDTIDRLRLDIVLMKRDLVRLLSFGEADAPDLPKWDAFHDCIALTDRALRRKLNVDDLTLLKTTVQEALRDIHQVLNTEEMSTSDTQSEQHIQQSKKESFDKEGSLAKRQDAQNLLPIFLQNCHAYRDFLPDKLRGPDCLRNAGTQIFPMIGISGQVWEEARRCFGAETASMIVLAMLERCHEIHVPGAYLRSLMKRAGEGKLNLEKLIFGLSAARAA